MFQVTLLHTMFKLYITHVVFKGIGAEFGLMKYSTYSQKDEQLHRIHQLPNGTKTQSNTISPPSSLQLPPNLRVSGQAPRTIQLGVLQSTISKKGGYGMVLMFACDLLAAQIDSIPLSPQVSTWPRRATIGEIWLKILRLQVRAQADATWGSTSYPNDGTSPQRPWSPLVDQQSPCQVPQ